MENKAREAGVNTKFQYTDKEPTGTCAVIVTEKYRYALIVTEKYRYAVIVTEKYRYAVIVTEIYRHAVIVTGMFYLS